MNNINHEFVVEISDLAANESGKNDSLSAALASGLAQAYVQAGGDDDDT
jgi:hypothetical protein